MPTIICDHCQYVGSGAEYHDRIADVEKHEKTCKENPDYQPEQEIEECEITLNPESNIWGYKCPCSGDPINADLAHSCPGFRLIGFKFMDETVFGLLIKYSVPGVTPRGYYAYYSDIETKQALEHHATHVLFRRQT